MCLLTSKPLLLQAGAGDEFRKFHPNFVIKKVSGGYMTAKGWNSKILLFWLAFMPRS